MSIKQFVSKDGLAVECLLTNMCVSMEPLMMLMEVLSVDLMALTAIWSSGFNISHQKYYTVTDGTLLHWCIYRTSISKHFLQTKFMMGHQPQWLLIRSISFLTDFILYYNINNQYMQVHNMVLQMCIRCNRMARLRGNHNKILI